MRYRFLTGLLLALLGLQGFAQRLPQEAPSEFLNQQLVNCLYQDSRGFLWVGTEGALYRYNGYAFRAFRHDLDDSLSISPGMVWAVCEDEAGFLWVGTESGLDRFDRRFETFQSFSLPSFGPSPKVQSLRQDRQGTLWVGTELGLFFRAAQADTFSRFREEGLSEKLSVTDLYEDPEGFLWVGSKSQGLFRLSPARTSSQNIPAGSGLGSSLINQIFASQAGELLVATGRGILRYEEASGRLVPLPLQGQDGKELLGSDVEAIAEDRAGRFWLGTFENGLFRYDPTKNQLRRFSTNPSQNPQPTEIPVTCLLSDRSGLLWIGTYLGGLRSFNPHEVRFGSLAGPENLNDPELSGEVFAVYEDPRRRLWLGTETGLRVYDEQGKIQYKNPLPLNCLLQDENGGCWLGTDGEGLQYLSAEAFQEQEAPARLEAEQVGERLASEGIVYALLRDRSEQLWVGTLQGLYQLSATNELQHHYQVQKADSNSLCDNEVHVLFQDRQDRLWVGTDGGMNYLTGDGMARLRLPGLAGQALQTAIYVMAEDSLGALWVGTAQGLVRIAPDRQQSRLFSPAEGLASAQVYGLLFDSNQHLWVSTKKGLSKVRPSPGGQTFSIGTFSSQQHRLPCEAFNFGAACQTWNGRLIFGCQTGAVVFYPEDIWENTYSPPVVLTDFQIGLKSVDFREPQSPLDQHIAETQSIQLPSDRYRLTFEFAALNFMEPENNRYRYLMENVDEEWVEDRGFRQAEYTLGPGRYRFLVQAANNEGIWNEAYTELEVVIEKPFTQTWWFYLLCALGIILLVILYVRYRTRQLEQNQRRLEEKVAQRTEEVRKKNEVLEKTLTDLKAAQTQLVEKEKMASLGQLTAGVAHEINNPITFVSGSVTPLRRDIAEMLEILQAYESAVKKQQMEPQFEEVESLKEELDYEFLVEEIRQLLEGIQEGADRTSEIVRGLRNFSRLDEDVLKPASVNEGIESTLLILRSELKNRIEIVKDMEEMPDIMCYPGKLNGVYMNILTNAAQAIEGEGKVFITTRYREEEVEIRFRDTGKGMSEEVKRRVFEPFFTTKEVGVGTGLGLSITYGTIEQHKGKIMVESEVGKGTTFTILLLLISNKREAAMTDKTPFSILYVDDEPHNLTTFKATFRRKYRVFTAGGGEEGLEVLRKHDIPLVISDQRMPGMTGVEFLARVAREFPNTMRIILTGYSDVEAIISAINKGAIFRYITKPWAETELQMTIENARQVYALQQRNRDLVRELQGRMTTQERTLRLFSRYVPEPVVKKALAKSDDSIFEGELAYVTVLFCDIRGFTSMSEDLPPDTIVRLLNDYYAMMTACVKSHHGSVCQFVGDEVFATFGAPLGTTQNEENAVYCALNMLDEIDNLSQKYKEVLKREIFVGIGIHAGEVITGNVGSEDRINYAITGRNVNLGRRIELLTKELPNGILISKPVYEQVRESIPAAYWSALNFSEDGPTLEVFRVQTQKT